MRGFTDSLRTELLHDGSNLKVSVLLLPSVNTPQFEVVTTRLPGMPRPVPPIYQPEMIAEAVLWAAEHRLREMVIAWSSLKAIVGQKIAPAFADRFLAKNGYATQQTDEPVNPDRPNNQYQPVPGNQEAHGAFGARARTWTPQLTARMNPLAVASVVSAAGLAAAAGMTATFLRRD